LPSSGTGLCFCPERFKKVPRQVEDRREDGRRRIPGFVGAVISFNGPDGGAHRFPVIELSLAGGSFEIPARVPGLKQGAICTGGRITVGELEIDVNMEIRHVTRGPGTVYECGARIFPTTDEGRNELAALVSRLNSMPG
jgi:hypothetical protein